MNILHIFISLTEDTGNFDRIKKMNAIFPQYLLSCDKHKLPDFSIKNFYRTTYFNFPKIEFLKNYFYNKASYNCFEKNLSDVKFDLIHSYFAYPCASAGQFIARKLNIPHVVTVRGSDVLIYPNQNKFLKNKIASTLKEADVVICLSQHLMNACADLGVKREKMVHLPEGHDAKVFYYDEKVKKENYILFAGNLIPVKNPLRLLSAFEILTRNNSTIQLKIAGSGYLKNDIQEFINQKKLNERISFLGQIPASVLSEQMRKAKLLVLPSLSEGWPNVIQESLACGTPVVASRVGGIPEIITEGENGFFCDHLSEQNIADQLEKSLAHPWDQTKIQKLPAMYTREKIIESILRLYQDTIKQ